MLKKVEYVMESFIFNSRWVLAPFFLGLIVCIGILLVKFTQELVHLLPTLLTTSENTIIVSVLTLVDITLVASLLLMIIFSGYEIFVSKIDSAEHKDRQALPVAAGWGCSPGGHGARAAGTDPRRGHYRQERAQGRAGPESMLPGTDLHAWRALSVDR